MTRCLIPFVLLTGFCSFAYGQRSIPDSLAFLFQNQLEVFPQEKIHLHTDKPYYISGEKIWFRAYLVDAATHIPLSLSRYVYVELINPLDSVVVRVKIREQDGDYHGHLPIPNDVPEGNYTLRAYTTFMQSLHEEYFYHKAIRIGDPQTDATLRSMDVDNSNPNDFDISFYPEGGSMMLGTTGRVAFKAMKSNGQAIDVSGTIYNQANIQITTFKSDYLGMGLFIIVPQKGESYYAICENDMGVNRRFNLPTAVDQGYALSTHQIKENIYISVLKPKEASDNNENLYLLAHTRGMVHFADLWDHRQTMAIIPKSLFPSGVLHLILFDSMLNPVSERLMFIHNDDQAKVINHEDMAHFSPRTLVKNAISITDHTGQPLSGSFSIAVTSDREVQPDTTSNIMTQLLLTSDIRGYIQNPSFYFQNTPESAMALELLMLTQGWRRYNIEALAQGRFTYPTSPLEVGPEISGTVKSVMLGRPVANIDVTAISLNYPYFNSTQTDNEGRFYLQGGELPDSTRFIVSVVPNRGMTRMDLILDKETFPQRSLLAYPPFYVESNLFAEYVNKAELQYIGEGGIRVAQLPDVIVTAERKPPKRSQLYSTPSHTITEEQIERFPTLDIFQIISQFPGVMVYGKSIIMRGVGTINGSTDPLVLIDNIPVDISVLEMLNVYDIAQIDLLSGANTSIFGSRGGNGVIVIFTKDGKNISQVASQPFHIKTILPLGYQQPIEFYSPKYQTDAQRNTFKPDQRTTIHWEPVVTTNSSGKASFEYYTADELTSYTLVIEGMAHDGTIIWYQEKLHAL